MLTDVISTSSAPSFYQSKRRREIRRTSYGRRLWDVEAFIRIVNAQHAVRKNDFYPLHRFWFTAGILAALLLSGTTAASLISFRDRLIQLVPFSSSRVLLQAGIADYVWSG